MPTLSSSFLNLTSLLDGLSELGIVKKHLLRASREVLLAVDGLLGFAEQQVTGRLSGADSQQTVQNVINYAQKTLKTLAQQLPRTDEDEYRSLHRKVMNSILDVLEGEISKNVRAKNQKAKMKAEVLEAIRKVLLKQMYEETTEKE
ncbi:MAG TPA: hypothetical protein VLJ37_10375 [bacterium]|nr:hypothetical protein [bacterium]